MDNCASLTCWHHVLECCWDVSGVVMSANGHSNGHAAAPMISDVQNGNEAKRSKPLSPKSRDECREQKLELELAWSKKIGSEQSRASGAGRHGGRGGRGVAGRVMVIPSFFALACASLSICVRVIVRRFFAFNSLQSMCFALHIRFLCFRFLYAFALILTMNSILLPLVYQRNIFDIHIELSTLEFVFTSPNYNGL